MIDHKPSPRALLLAAIQCDMAYIAPTWGPVRNAQIRVSMIDGIQFLAVAGTKNKGDVLNDLSITWVKRTRLGRVRNGFADAWDPIRDENPMTYGLTRDLPVFMTGHSLGAVLAQYQAKELLHKGYDVLGGVDFGSPTGWHPERGKPCDIPWMHIKNGWDVVAGRPNVLYSGVTPGEWWQVKDGELIPGMRHPARSWCHPFRGTDNHKLFGPYGYIATLGRMAEKAGEVEDWHDLPEAREWASAVVAWKLRRKT